MFMNVELMVDEKLIRGRCQNSRGRRAIPNRVFLPWILRGPDWYYEAT